MASTITPLNLWQKAFLLTWESNGVGDTQGDTQTLARTLKAKLMKFLALSDIQQAMEGTWSIAWGPVVFEAKESSTSYADNVMYVAASPDRSVYVVAIAGTNGSSDYDKNDEDNSVNTTTLWTSAFPGLPSYSVPSGINPWPVLSSGTALGTNNLLGMTDTVTTQQTLVDFLKSLSATGSKTLIFGGHSLGGALAPTLALALFNPSGGVFSTGSWENVYVLPVAGPTPGNQGLSEFFGQVFPPVSLDPKQPQYAWNQDIWNSLDAVPHAWVVDMLNEIPTLYPTNWPDGQVPSDITNLVNAAVQASQLGGALPGPYTQLPNVETPGDYSGSNPITTEDQFWAEVAYQHLTAYQTLFDIESLISEGTQTAVRQMLKRWLSTFPRRAAQSVKRTAAAR
ncbi:alpha/beta fold hydrolase [Myxococcaceae bacterium JPH2]|nr:alpha/beta fold hydrolase [Myxococcaceae bacterium JPH2]